MNRHDYFLENNQILSKFVFIGSIITLIYMTFIRLYYVSPYASTWDQVDFALALSRFDLLAMQPHFPGYPYFILAGMFVNHFIANPSSALATANVLLMCSAIFPIYKLARVHLSRNISLLLVVVIQTTVYVNVIVTQSMSEGMAIAVIWWFFLSVYFASKSERISTRMIVFFLFSVILGIRLSFIAFGVVLLFLWWNDSKHSVLMIRIKKLLFYGIWITCFQFIWVVALAATEGSIVGFIKLALSFTDGHFNEWGGTASVDNEGTIQRLVKLVVFNLFWAGISADSIFLGVLYSILFLVFFYKIKEYVSLMDHDKWIIITVICYFLWALFAQNIDKPRHISPLVGVILFYTLVCLLKNSRSSIILLLIGIVVVVQLFLGTKLIREQAESLPATYQLAHYLQLQKDNIIVYTWEETRVFEYLQMDFKHKRVLTYDYFLQDLSYNKHDTIFITNKVVQGFEEQGIDTSNHIEKIETFSSNPLFDPIYSQITLYKWKTER
ncbi:nucleoporin-interacting protein [Bacillus timonensis]|nr:nucleoporin-interacting protein [Bacillus timonensis]